MPYKREAYQLNQFPEDTTVKQPFCCRSCFKKEFGKIFSLGLSYSAYLPSEPPLFVSYMALDFQT